MVEKNQGFTASTTWRDPHPFAGTVQTLWDDDADAARVFPTEAAAWEAVKAFIALCDWLTPDELVEELTLWNVEPNA